MTQVVLVRPWTSARSGGGCCGGEVGHGIAPLSTCATAAPPTDHADPVGQVYRLLREQRPDLDVQVVDAGNTLWLVPTVFRAVRRREGWRAAVGAALHANRAGEVLVDGRPCGDVEVLGPDGVVAATLCCRADNAPRLRRSRGVA